jgi:hypothetical protein
VPARSAVGEVIRRLRCRDGRRPTGPFRPGDRLERRNGYGARMADDKPDPIANTAAFRAFSAGEHSSEPVRRKPTPNPLVFVTAIVLLVALVLGVLAFAL